eukprot:10042476-Alexandrium_andersonii.AAC.1
MARALGLLLLACVALAARADAPLPCALGVAGRPDTCPAHAAERGKCVLNDSFCDHRVLES